MWPDSVSSLKKPWYIYIIIWTCYNFPGSISVRLDSRHNRSPLWVQSLSSNLYTSCGGHISNNTPYILRNHTVLGKGVVFWWGGNNWSTCTLYIGVLKTFIKILLVCCLHYWTDVSTCSAHNVWSAIKAWSDTTKPIISCSQFIGATFSDRQTSLIQTAENVRCPVIYIYISCKSSCWNIYTSALRASGRSKAVCVYIHVYMGKLPIQTSR